MKKKSDVVTLSKRGLKLIDVDRSINHKFLAYLFSVNLCWAVTADGQKYAVNRTLSLLKSETVFAGKWHLNFVFEARDGWFVWFSFCTLVIFTIIRKSNIKIDSFFRFSAVTFPILFNYVLSKL